MNMYEVIDSLNGKSEFIKARDEDDAIEKYLSKYGPKFSDYYNNVENIAFSLDKIESIPEKNEEYENAQEIFKNDYLKMMKRLLAVRVYNDDENNEELNQ